MKYFNRLRGEIDCETWFRHMLDSDYTYVDRHVYGSTDICTSWIGIRTDYDDKPVLWCTIVRRWNGSDPVLNMAVWSDWDVSLEKVKEIHINLAKEIGIPFGETRREPTKRGKK